MDSFYLRSSYNQTLYTSRMFNLFIMTIETGTALLKNIYDFLNLDWNFEKKSKYSPIDILIICHILSVLMSNLEIKYCTWILLLFTDQFDRTLSLINDRQLDSTSSYPYRDINRDNFRSVIQEYRTQQNRTF